MTAQLPSIELINSLHSFPGPYIFKIIGDNREEFLADALSLAMTALHEDREFSHSIRASKSGNHLAITLSVVLNSAGEVHAVYQSLLKLQGIRALF